MHTPKKAILVSLIISILLLVIKFGAFFYTQSNSILTDAAESIVNVIASAFAFYSIYLSELPKDENHPYGHGKVEFFSVFIEGVLIMIAGVVIVLKSSFNLFFTANEIAQIQQGAVMIGFTGFINLLLSLYLVRQSKRLNSITLEADGKHIMTDAISSGGLMFALLIVYFTEWYFLDSVISILLSFFIIFSGYKLLRKSIAGLMDESDPELVNNLINDLAKHRKPEWIDIHNLRMQQYGAHLHIDCHVTLPFYFELEKVHREVTYLENVINQERSHLVEFFIHSDPCLPKCCSYCLINDCKFRKTEFENKIEWNPENITKNQKHF